MFLSGWGVPLSKSNVDPFFRALLLMTFSRALRPGGGIEFQEFHGISFCDNQTMEDDDPFRVLYELTGQAYSTLGFSMSLPAELEPMLLADGFENVHR